MKGTFWTHRVEKIFQHVKIELINALVTSIRFSKVDCDASYVGLAYFSKKLDDSKFTYSIYEL